MQIVRPQAIIKNSTSKYSDTYNSIESLLCSKDIHHVDGNIYCENHSISLNLITEN